MTEVVSVNYSRTEKNTTRYEFRRGLKEAIPVMIGFVPFALVLGALAVQKGLTLFQVPMLTGLNFGGGSEFTALNLWTSPPHVLLIVTMSLLVNSRHLLMGAAFTPLLKGISSKKAMMSLFFMCDESWAMAIADAKRRASCNISLPYYLGVSLGLYITWIVFTTLGAIVGPILGDVEAYGFEMAFTAVFLVLLKSMWKGVRAAIPWFVSLSVACATYLLVSGAWYVAAGALSGLLVALVMEKNHE